MTKSGPQARFQTGPAARRYGYSLLSAAVAGALAPAYVIRWHVGPLPTTLLEVALLVTIAIFVLETIQWQAAIPWRGPLTWPAAPPVPG